MNVGLKTQVHFCQIFMYRKQERIQCPKNQYSNPYHPNSKLLIIIILFSSSLCFSLIQGAFKYYISTFFKFLNPPLHQRNQRGSRPPTPLYFADVILEQVAWVSILFRGLFSMLFMIISGTKIIIKLKNDTSLSPIIQFISKFGDHNYLLLQSEYEFS